MVNTKKAVYFLGRLSGFTWHACPADRYSFIVLSVFLQMMESEQTVHNLRIQLTAVQGHHKESMEQLGDRSRNLAALKTELARMQQQNASMNDEACKFYFSFYMSQC